MFVVAALTLSTLALTDRSVVNLATPEIRLGDITNGGGRLALIVIARLPRGRDETIQTRQALAAFLRRAVPGIIVLGSDAGGAITFRVAATARSAEVACYAARASIAVGGSINGDTVAARPCDTLIAPGLVGYDVQRGEIVARRPIAAGTNIGSMRLPTPPAVRAGDALTLVSRAGPVTVERSVTALQAGRNGRRLFVRDRAGHVSSIEFVGADAP